MKKNRDAMEAFYAVPDKKISTSLLNNTGPT